MYPPLWAGEWEGKCWIAEYLKIGKEKKLFRSEVFVCDRGSILLLGKKNSNVCLHRVSMVWWNFLLFLHMLILPGEKDMLWNIDQITRINSFFNLLSMQLSTLRGNFDHTTTFIGIWICPLNLQDIYRASCEIAFSLSRMIFQWCSRNNVYFQLLINTTPKYCSSNYINWG